jgi:hypothetical protein
MNLRNRIALIATSAVTVGAIVLAGPALAHTKPGPKATTKPAATATATPAPVVTPPAFGGPDKDRHGKKHDGRGPREGAAPIAQTVTVDVPETGTYQLLVTEVKPANTSPTQPVVAPDRPDHSFTVPVTGTGSQTVTLNLPHPGNYTVALVNVVSTQSITVPLTK